MVSTRSSSGALPPPPAAPTKTPRKPGSGRPPSSRKSASSSSSPAGWSHTPSTLTLLWLGVSLPLVAWDTGYVLLRPRSMPGGSLHWPLWAPYELYGRVDHMYGLKQWSAGNGFTAAQGTLNLVESALYAAYLWLWYSRAVGGGAGRGRRALVGRAGGLALVVGFSAAVMTLSKTVLYWLNEYFSSYDNIGHNNLVQLIFLWIIPNGAWLLFPTFMIIGMGSDIIDGLAAASEAGVKSE